MSEFRIDPSKPVGEFLLDCFEELIPKDATGDDEPAAIYFDTSIKMGDQVVKVTWMLGVMAVGNAERLN